MEKFKRLCGVRAMMALLLIVLVMSIVWVASAKADEPAPQEFPKTVSPKIWEWMSPEFTEEFLVTESDGAVNAADIAFANNNEVLVAWQEEVRICHQWCEFVLRVFAERLSVNEQTAGKILLAESKSTTGEPDILYRGAKSLSTEASATGVFESMNSWAGNPSVAWNPVSGNFLVAFWSNAEGFPRIYAWQISSGGKLGAGKLRIGNDGKNIYRQFYPSIAVSPEGNYLVVWEQDREEEPGAFQVFGQWLDQNIQPIGENFQISRGTYEQHPKLVWVSQRNALLLIYIYPYIDYAGAHVEIRGQWLSTSREIGEPFLVSEDLLDKGVPSLTVNTQGEVLAVWGAADGKIYGRLINSWNNTQVLAETKGQILGHPKVASFGKDGFLLIWEQFPPYGYADASRVWGKMLKLVKPKPFFGPTPKEPVLIAGKPFQLSQSEVNQRFPGVGTWNNNGLAVWEVDNGAGGLWGRFFEQAPVQ